MRFLIAGGALGELRLEAAALLDRIVELAEGVGDFEAADVELEALDRVGIVGALLRQRRHFGRKVVDERRLDQVLFPERLEDRAGDLAGAGALRNLDAELRARAAVARVERCAARRRSP